MADPAPKTAIRHHLVFAHPDRSSFNGQIVDTYVETASRLGQEVVVRDLYAMAFDPVLRAEERPLQGGGGMADDVAAEVALLREADALVLVYPIWFALPPAILKGYVDRVLGAGYSFRDIVAETGHPALKGKPLLSFSTSGTSLPWRHEHGQVLSLREIFDVYLWQAFAMQQSEHVMIDNVVPDMSAAYAEEQLGRVEATVERLCAKLLSDRHAARTAAVMDGGTTA